MRDRLQHRKDEFQGILAMLRGYRQAQDELEDLRVELRHCIEQREEIARSVPARALNGMPGGKGRKNDPTLRAVEILDEQFHEREALLLGRIRILMKEREAIEQEVERLDYVEQRIIRMRWMQRRSWVYIAFQLELSDRQCQRIHIGALQKMAGKGCDEKNGEKERRGKKKMSFHVG